MSKPTIVLVDPDANYLAPLEDKITEELYEQIELEVITSLDYFNAFFSSPRKIDILIISSALYNRNLMRHNITDCFVLTEDYGETIPTENVTCIFKYTSAKDIFNQILYKNKTISGAQLAHKETQVIAVTSAIGGSGKTTISLALCSSLARSHKRVLYLSTDIMQGFAFYLQNKNPLSNDIVRIFSGADDTLYNALLPYLRNEGFSYLPPFRRSILTIGLDTGIYNRIIHAAKAAKAYDYIVVDMDLNLDEAKAELIQISDTVIINVLQDAYSTYKTESLVRNLDCRNKEKFVFVCNKFRRDVNNDYIDSPVGQQHMITEYIDEVPLHKIHSLDSFTDLTAVRNLAYLFC